MYLLDQKFVAAVVTVSAMGKNIELLLKAKMGDEFQRYCILSRWPRSWSENLKLNL